MHAWLRFIGVLSPLSFIFTVWRKGTQVGTDQLGNRYFKSPARKGYKHEQRWVLYPASVEPDASRVPPEWHGWLHHQTDRVPDADAVSYRKPWQLGPRMNLTGTDLAYRPPGHQSQGGKRPAATGDYEPWNPNA